MSATTATLRRQIDSAGDLQSVVRTMKTLAASSIGQYEASVRALADYSRTVELGLGACFRAGAPADEARTDEARPHVGVRSVVVFGSDQGLVGQFNERVAHHAIAQLATLSGDTQIWAVGERVQARLVDADVPLAGVFAVPSSVKSITPLVGQILVEAESRQGLDEDSELHLLYNRPQSGSLYGPVSQRLLPLDAQWRRDLAARPWPTRSVPDVIGSSTATLRALVHEYLFVSLFRACAESLASENASRLAAMQRADKNIDELLGKLNTAFQRVRQSGIDEELFDVVAGFEALEGGVRGR